MLDPACGSGAFLVQVFDYLSAEGQALNDELARLSLGLRSTDDLSRNILTNNIFGVDINPESVEISKLSLWLKTADNQSELTALDHNIRCGNSLIDDPQVAGDLAFDWKTEFADIFQKGVPQYSPGDLKSPGEYAGGFDVVVGNPPYVPSTSISQKEKEFFYKNFNSAEYQLNTYGLFIERTFSVLTDESWYSVIIPNYWLSTKYDQKLRELVFAKNQAVEVLNTFQVFKDATVDTLLLVGKRTFKPDFPKSVRVRSIAPKLDSVEARLQAINNLDFAVDKEQVFESSENLPLIAFDENVQTLTGKENLAHYFDFFKGMQPYEEGKGNPKQTRDMMNQKIYHSDKKVDETYLPLLTATSVKRYRIAWEGKFIKYGKHLAAPRKKEIFENQRILLNRLVSGKHLDAVLLEESYVNNTDVFNLIPRPEITDSQKTKALFAIIASRLCADYFK